MNKLFTGLLLLVAPFVLPLHAQTPTYQPGELLQKLHKLNVLGTVLYVAAHPDDENTRLITYYANEKLMRTGYLAATRGDGGQNLIGPEIRESLGVIRTQELLAARRTDGGQQFFSRANDFGYSKNPEETFTIWDREDVLADFVWVFRKFRPDVIITRFNSEGRNHGHHTASAILAKEAFKLAGDPNAFPDQLDFVDVWEPKKIFWNTGWWWLRSSSDTTGLTSINMGAYNPLLGESYGEIAAKSRSMHKSQGFGSSGARGDQIEYLKQWGGAETPEPFDDITTSWERVSGAEEVKFYIDKAISEYDPTAPWEIAEPLVLARKALASVSDPYWKEVKTSELDELILAVTGTYLSLTTEEEFYTPGDSIQIELEAVNRSAEEITLEKVTFPDWINPVRFQSKLLLNKPLVTEMNFAVPANKPYSTPYWLTSPAKLGMYTVEEQELIGKPENDPPFSGDVLLTIGGEQIEMNVPVTFKKTDPVAGEVRKPISIGPPVMTTINEKVLVFGDNQSKEVEVRVIAGKAAVSGDLKLELPKGWKSAPERQAYALERSGDEAVYSFDITPPKGASKGALKAIATLDGKEYSRSKISITYDHIPAQVIYPESQVRVVRVDLKKKGNLIGYVEGAGDAIPENLAQVGYEVHRLSKDDITIDNLEKYDAIVLGVRAFNTVSWLSFKNQVLFEYVKLGGTVLVQYNTNRRLVTEEVAPFDLKISRDRVAVEQAAVEILAPNHPVMNQPNKITARDFEGWVQERGLYFPDEWSEEFTPIFSSNDPGESPKEGGLLVARYGEGYYVYSGYSWFRELPAGVSGAYRIFVNLISLGND